MTIKINVNTNSGGGGIVSEKKIELLSNKRYKDPELLYISSHFFIIPAALAICKENYCIWFFSCLICITSLLSWGHINNRLYYVLDLFIVRFCVLVMILFSYYHLIYNKKDYFIHFFLACLLGNIVFFYYIGVILFIYNNKYCTISHMIMHFFGIFSMIYCIYCNFDIIQTYINIYKQIISDLKVFQYPL